MAVDPKHLRKLTLEAIQRGKDKKKYDDKLARDAEERHLRAQERRAHTIIDGIPARAEKEAENEKSHAIIMAVKHEDFIKPTYGNTESSSNLKDAAKMVWDYCVTADLKPTIEYWYSGDDLRSGYNIVIHW